MSLYQIILFLVFVQEPEELFETISQALLNAVDRDALSGWGGVVHIMWGKWGGVGERGLCRQGWNKCDCIQPFIRVAMFETTNANIMGSHFCVGCLS